MAKPWIGYVRLSTMEQADTNALRNQIESLKAAGAEEVFYDIERDKKRRDPILKRCLSLLLTKKLLASFPRGGID